MHFSIAAEDKNKECVERGNDSLFGASQLFIFSYLYIKEIRASPTAINTLSHSDTTHLQHFHSESPPNTLYVMILNCFNGMIFSCTQTYIRLMSVSCQGHQLSFEGNYPATCSTGLKSHTLEVHSHIVI